jgi:hypothetical protein
MKYSPPVSFCFIHACTTPLKNISSAIGANISIIKTEAMGSMRSSPPLKMRKANHADPKAIKIINIKMSDC